MKSARNLIVLQSGLFLRPYSLRLKTPICAEIEGCCRIDPQSHRVDPMSDDLSPFSTRFSASELRSCSPKSERRGVFRTQPGNKTLAAKHVNPCQP